MSGISNHRPSPYAIRPQSLGWALIGASAVAESVMVDAIRSQPPLEDGSAVGAWIVGIHSHSPLRARRFAERNHIPHATHTLDDLLGRHDVQCAYVGNHPRHHAESVLAALRAGKHVLCEPPLALSAEEAQALMHTAADRGLQLGLNLVRRADPVVRALAEMLSDGALGDLVGARLQNALLLPVAQQTWRLQPVGGGVLFDRSMHSIDLLRFVFSDEIAEVAAATTQRILGFTVEEDVVMTVRLRRSNLLVQVHDSFITPHIPTALEIYGSAAMLYAEHCLDDSRPSRLTLHRNQHSRVVPLQDVNVWQASVAAFCRAVRSEAELLATAQDGIATLTAILAAQQALQRGTPVQLARR